MSAGHTDAARVRSELPIGGWYTQCVAGQSTLTRVCVCVFADVRVCVFALLTFACVRAYVCE